MPLSGTFTLNSNYVIIEPVTTTIVTPIGDAAIGEITQVGSDVASWDVGDTIYYNNSENAVFKNNDSTWTLVNQSNIYFKYESAPEP
jgi:co-chaperonin GroES (HSP10)